MSTTFLYFFIFYFSFFISYTLSAVYTPFLYEFRNRLSTGPGHLIYLLYKCSLYKFPSQRGIELPELLILLFVFLNKFLIRLFCCCNFYQTFCCCLHGRKDSAADRRENRRPVSGTFNTRSSVPTFMFITLAMIFRHSALLAPPPQIFVLPGSAPDLPRHLKRIPQAEGNAFQHSPASYLLSWYPCSFR